MLAPKLDLSAASALMTTLKALDQKDIVLDMSEVNHFGALCLQVLVASARNQSENDRKMSFINVSDRVCDQMRVMGVAPESIARGQQ